MKGYEGAAIMVESLAQEEQALALAARWGLPVITRGDECSPPFILMLTGGGLELRSREALDGPGLRPVFDASIGRGISRRDPLVRALGRETRRVVDATAGWGRDAFRLALLGFEVIACERNPVMAALLVDGWARARAEGRVLPEVAERLRFLAGEARMILPTLEPAPESVVIDPMFPPKKRASAKAKKPMQWLRGIAGDDPDAADLLAIARETATDRVIVKRSDDGPPLLGGPSYSITTKLVRFDVYVRAAETGAR